MLRYERKYVISVRDFVLMERRLAMLMHKDPHCAAGPYQVRSLYFDTLEDDALQDNLAGVWNKQKLRLRTYNLASGPFMLEYKCKTGELGTKMKLTVTRQEAEQLVMGRFDFLGDKNDRLAAELFATVKMDCFLPRTVVDYRRIAYVEQLNDTRVTFDDNVAACQSTRDFFSENLPLVPLMPPDKGVLEVKYNGFLPSVVEQALETASDVGTTVANSKYVQARL